MVTMDVDSVALPPEGSRPIPMVELSPSARNHMSKIKRMLASEEEKAEKLASTSVPNQAYIDPILKKPGQMKKLVKRMIRSGMVRRVTQCRGRVGLFVVVKSAERAADGSIQMVQRLIFDQRADNCSWKDPPWIGLAGPTAIAALDFSQSWEEGMEMCTSSGDLPNYYYTLELPEEFSEFFCLPEVEAEDVLQELLSEGWEDPLGLCKESGNFLALRVPPMGWSWAVVLAQLCLQDMVSAQDPNKLWQAESRVVEGGVTPSVSLHRPASIVYIDDFGSVGIRWPGKIGAAVPEKAKEAAASHIRSQGLQVHKEEVGPSHQMVLV